MEGIKIEIDQPVKPLEYVFGVVRLPQDGGKRLFFGWNTDGLPSCTTDTNFITPTGRNFLSENPIAPFPFDAKYSSYTPQVFEFMEMAQPIDNQDKGTQFTEDVVNIGCTDKDGALKFLKIKELELMDAIMKGQIDWQIGGTKSYSLIIPDAETETLNFVLFSPEDQPTNELGYRTFLLKTIKILVTIDRNQVPPDQKGYLSVIKAIMDNLEQKAAAKKVAEAPRGLTKIATELGILQEVETVESNQLGYLSVFQLRFVVQKLQEVVAQSFTKGKEA